MINVTKTYLPNLQEYVGYLEEIWKTGQLTNDGPLARKLEQGLRDYLGVQQLSFCSNGTVVLEIAMKILELKGEIITTPFSYVATTNAILWENCEPVFVDIDSATYCINPALIEASITERTSAILATHVYGNACDVEAIEAIAKKHNLYVIYDGAHGFGARYKGQSLLSYGDLVTCSFHATKVFHTVEGGALMTNRPDWQQKLKFMRAFGHQGDNYFFVGINGKNSELHAAMGLCVLPKIGQLIAGRKAVCDYYDAQLDWSKLKQPTWATELTRNYSYYPVVFQSEDKLLEVMAYMIAKGVTPRRYFYPSLNKLHFLANTQPCPVSEDIAPRVLCLPLHAELNDTEAELVVRLIKEIL
jgi:dTDP-4-amino-4,6-dideoxygalactose transaminase